MLASEISQITIVLAERRRDQQTAAESSRIERPRRHRLARPAAVGHEPVQPGNQSRDKGV